MKIKEIIFCTFYILVAVMGMSLIKAGGQTQTGFCIAGYNVNFKSLLGIAFYGISFLMYTLVISQLQISLVIPILAAANSCAVVLVGIIIFGEHLNIGQGFGMILVLMGVICIGIFTK